jgi:hypothetical protein
MERDAMSISALDYSSFLRRPGSISSPWNIPLAPSDTCDGTAPFARLAAGLSSWGRPAASSVPVYDTTDSSPVVPVLYCPAAYANIASGVWARAGNSAAIESAILAACSNQFPVSRFVYSTASPSGWTVPDVSIPLPNLPGGQAIRAYLPQAAVPCLDSDGHMAVYQPSGYVLETYSTIILSTVTNAIVCLNANFTDPTGLLDGTSGGLTASMLPNYGGLIKQTDITSGVIAHAMAIVIPQTQLVSAAVYPALTFDRANGYSGSIPMGARLAIPQSVNLATYPWMCAEGKMIGVAAQQFGMYVCDSGGGGVTIRCEEAIVDPEFVNVPGSPDYNLFNDVAWIIHNVQRVTG